MPSGLLNASTSPTSMSTPLAQLERILVRDLALCTKLHTIKTVSGGCINEAFKCVTDTGDYFVKVNRDGNVSSLQMFEGEAESLNAISEAVPGFSPTPLGFGRLVDGDDRGGSFLVTTFHDLVSRSGRRVDRQLASKLAEMHKCPSPNGKFGFDVVTMCGSTPQDNTWESDWPTFLLKRRFEPLLQMVLEKHPGDKELRSLGPRVMDGVATLFKGLDVRPSLVHGDLWSGNWGVDSARQEPLIFDPAASYSHAEFDLAIMKVFGGFSADFFNAYHEVHPKHSGFEVRLQLYQAYHYLNHYCLFGQGYRASTLSALGKVAKAIENEE
ncbi:ketosamine-3-kinase [Fimicolochytrium jonesii]|uniref:ketosamine-3-kinase n=1 Tax=Fimicolochytrium jonesii TaxID=1396493 RepID=UPI0022FEAAEB|nr:ketosamine-3-kinase [Fimicolochytrium jonesii]KAI8824430.1 ketosamine-3-kinase [Fimicolochytrium jonesii]